MTGHFRPGDAVVLREVWHGRVLEARPATVVRDGPEAAMFYVHPGTTLKVAFDVGGNLVRIPRGDWTLEDWVRGGSRILSFAWPDVAHAVLMRWDEDGAFLGWYVNLQTPLRRTAIGFDYMDHFLDVVVDPDGAWRWKDEGELEEVVRLGLVAPDDARAFRLEGTEVIARIRDGRTPFDDTWLGWQPDPSWRVPELLPGWEGV